MMIVYGEATRRERPVDKLARIRAHLEAADRSSVGIVRHGFIAAALIEAGELAQGVADSEFAARGDEDARSPAGDATLALAVRLARLLDRSWAAAFSGTEPTVDALLASETPSLPPEIEARTPEGFAFYALYPEAYLESAKRLREGAPVRVIGLRSIGTTLAAAIAATLAEPARPLTVRPVGHPFDRRLSLAPALAKEIAAEPDAVFAIADEGPGLSGSSFGAAVRSLESLGVASERINLFPSHGNDPGPEATEPNRAAWRRTRQHVTTLDDLVLDTRAPQHRLPSWFADLVGEPVAPLEDLSGGLWRRHIGVAEANWPPAQTSQERRKFLLRTESGALQLKFAGLGELGMRKFDRARALCEAGFSTEPIGWRHGFLAERWTHARTLSPEGLADHDRSQVIAHVGQYLGFRSRRFRRAPGSGASLDALLAMARHNAGEALGEPAAAALAARQSHVPALERHNHPVEIDGRLQLWEWLDAARGLVKTDALDHHAGHDLVGCQDVAWDVAGASVEFDLSSAEAETLMAIVEQDSGRPVDPDLVRFLLPCYLAFQLGSWTMAGLSASVDERERLGTVIARYRRHLAHALEGIRE